MRRDEEAERKAGDLTGVGVSSGREQLAWWQRFIMVFVIVFVFVFVFVFVIVFLLESSKEARRKSRRSDRHWSE